MFCMSKRFRWTPRVKKKYILLIVFIWFLPIISFSNLIIFIVNPYENLTILCIGNCISDSKWWKSKSGSCRTSGVTFYRIQVFGLGQSRFVIGLATRSFFLSWRVYQSSLPNSDPILSHWIVNERPTVAQSDIVLFRNSIYITLQGL